MGLIEILHLLLWIKSSEAVPSTGRARTISVKDTKLQVGTEVLLEFQLILQQRLVLMEEITALEGRLYGITSC